MIYETRYGNIYYECHGPENAPVVVLTHGLGMDNRTFDSQVGALLKNYRAIVWDMPGHGDSFAVDNLTYKMSSDCLSELLEELKVKKATLVGLSLGGQVSQYFAYNYPDKVSGVVDIGSLPLHKGISKKEKRYYSFLLKFIKFIPKWILFRWFARSKSINKETREYLKEVTSKTGKRQLISFTKSVVREMSKGIDKPIKHSLLITHGEKEDKFIINGCKKWHQEVPESEYWIIKNAGHIANQDNPKEFNKMLLSFLKKLKIQRS